MGKFLIFVFVMGALLSSPIVRGQIPQPSPSPRPRSAVDDSPGIFKEEIQQPQPPAVKKRRVRRVQPNTDSQVNLALTHILPSAFVIPAGTVVLGTSAGFGLFNFLDFSTNLYLDLEQVYNASATLSLLHGQNFALGPRISYVTESLQLSGTDPNTGLPTITTFASSSVIPGITISYRILNNLTGHTGGDYVIQSPVITKSSLPERTALIQGTTGHQEFTVGLSRLVAMSFGGSYDFTYDIWGTGLSFHLAGFQLGVHYYLNVSQGSFMPLIGWGFASSY